MNKCAMLASMLLGCLIYGATNIAAANESALRVAQADSIQGAARPFTAKSDTALLEEVVVTGSRLPSTALTSAAPVTIVDRTQIEATGAANVGELLRDFPAATASASESAGRGNDGSASVALRGLGAVNTLVLINGRRVLADSAGGTVDLNSIPFEAIDRVEVLQDGASAIYGSDAIAGVVNIIMRKSYDGALVKAYYGRASRGDLPDRHMDLVFGHAFDRGGFVFSGSFRNAGGNVIAARPVSTDPDWRAKGGRNFRDPLPLVATLTCVSAAGCPFADPSVEYIIKEGVRQATTPADLRPFSFPGAGDPLSIGDDGINYWKYESSASELSTRNISFSGDYNITNGMSAFVEASFNSRKSLGFLAPDYFGAVYGDPVTVAADNIYNPYGVALLAARTVGEQPRFARRSSNVDANTFRAVVGVQGKFATWNWDASYNYQSLSQDTYNGEGILRDKLREAVGGPATCNADVDGCVPLNVFGGPGTITPPMLDFISADAFTITRSFMDAAVLNLNGPVFSMPAGEVNAAVGVEYRRETYSENHDRNSELNAFVSRGPAPDAFPPGRRVTEAYAEVSLPLLKNMPMARSLDLEGAVRYSRYNQFGNTTNPKVGIRWRPIDNLMFRGTWGSGFRAPTFTEAYGGQTAGFSPITDPCLGANYASLPGCGGVQATTTSTGAFIVSGGNAKLKPEDAETFTLGAVFTPNFGRGLVVTVDYFQIKKTGVIGDINRNYILMQNALFGTFADRVVRDPITHAVTSVIATRSNLVDQQIKGIDASVRYRTPEFSWGGLSMRLDVTRLLTFKQPQAPGVPATERLGTYADEIGTLAKYRASTSVTWAYHNLSATYGGRYVGPVTNTGGEVHGKVPEVGSYFQSDLQGGYAIEPLRLKFALGIENVFDRMPPFLEGNFANGFDQGSFNSRGRFFYGRIEKKF